jgi:hypothetical protein
MTPQQRANSPDLIRHVKRQVRDFPVFDLPVRLFVVFNRDMVEKVDFFGEH